MVDINLLPAWILQTLVELGFSYTEISHMSRHSVINNILLNEGIIGYTDKIITLIDSVKEAENVIS